MAAEHDGHVFNLKAVVKQTGLKPDTLRAWERRYGLPTPDRSAGKHRLYSQHDVDAIRWLIARQGEGLSISRAVDLWRQLESGGRDPLLVPVPTGSLPAAVAAQRAQGGTSVQFREDWLSACKAFDEQRAEEILTQAFALYQPESVVLDLLQKGIAELGDAWYRGEVTVQQEHFASALAIRRLETLNLAAPLPTRPGRILAACPSEERHVLGLLLVTFLLRRRGWTVVYLGADVPGEQLAGTVKAVRPQLVILAAQQLHSAATLLELANGLASERVPLGYGGLVFNWQPALRSRIPGHFLGDTVESAARMAEMLLLTPRPAPDVPELPDAYRRARQHYRDQIGSIEARVSEAAFTVGIAAHHLSVANREMALNIEAALALGNIEFLGADIGWVEGLLSHHLLPTQMLPAYLRLYCQAAREKLDARAEPVLAWLGRFAD